MKLYHFDIRDERNEVNIVATGLVQAIEALKAWLDDSDMDDSDIEGFRIGPTVHRIAV